MTVPSENLIYRETEVIAIKDLDRSFIRPELIRVKLDSSTKLKPLDVGSLAYAIRGRNPNSQEQKGNPVKISSLIEGRRELLSCIFYLFSVTPSHNTILTTYNYFSTALDWCDINGHGNCFDNIVDATVAYGEYSQQLFDRVMSEKLQPRSANSMQKGFLKLIDIRFPDEKDYVRGKVLKIKSKTIEGKPPRRVHVLNYFFTCLTLARSIDKFLVDFGSFPLVVDFNTYAVTVFPSNQGFLGPWMRNKNKRVYNYVERRLATPEEYTSAAGTSVSNKNNYIAITEALENLTAANSDNRHRFRMQLASLGLKAYASVFLCITGATPTEFSQFDHLESLDLGKSPLKNELSAVKFRAGGKKTKYAIGRRNGLGVLNDYLKFRDWILGEQQFDGLFFEMGQGYAGNIKPLNKSFTAKLYRSISYTFMDPSVPNIPGRLGRRSKSSVMHSLGIDHTIVAEVLGHTTKTNLASYSEACEEKQESELGLYWESVRRAADRFCRSKDESRSSTAAGSCNELLKPKSIEENPRIIPSCRVQQGCLYCENYVCHADEEDIHKLLSLQYVANAIRALSPDEVHADSLYKDLCIRVEIILETISKRSNTASDLVKSMIYRVRELGILTSFWERKLQYYEAVGVVF
jgi:hypothetical protein